MYFPLTKGEQRRFTPPQLQGQDGAPVYLIGVPTVAGKAQLRAELARAGMRHWGRWEFGQAMRNFIEDNKPEERMRMLDSIEAVEAFDLNPPRAAAAGDSPDGPVDPAVLERAAAMARWDELLEEITPQSADVAGMIADNVFYNEMSPYVAASLFLQGWENIAVEFKRLQQGVPFDVLQHLPWSHISGISGQVNQMLLVSMEQEKNFGSPSQSKGFQAATGADGAHQAEAAGTSAEIATT